jgi:hypothetical protein
MSNGTYFQIVPHIVAIAAGGQNEAWVACSDNSIWHLVAASTIQPDPAARDPGIPWIWQKMPPIPFPSTASGYGGYSGTGS